MNPLIWILIEAGLNIAKNHATGGGAVKLGGFLFDAAQALDQLSIEETGQPLDWDKIREHQHLPPAGEAPAEPAGPDLSMKPGSEPEAIAAAAETELPTTTQPPDEDPHPDPDPDPEVTDPGLDPTG